MEWTVQDEQSTPTLGLTIEEELLSRLIQQNCEEARAKVLSELGNHQSSSNATEELGPAWQDDVQHKTQELVYSEPSYKIMPTNGRIISLPDDLTGSERRQVSDDTNLNAAKGDEVLVITDCSPDDSSLSDSEFVDVPQMNITHHRRSLLEALNKFNSKVVEPQRDLFQRSMDQVEQMVNAVLERVENLDAAFTCRRVSPESLYERHSRNRIDICVVLSNVLPESFVLEDMKTPTGFARVRMTSSVPSLAEYCTETESGEYYLSPKKLCKKFASLVGAAASEVLNNGFVASQQKRVSFYSEASRLDDMTPCTVNLLPTIQCPDTWPLCACWLRTCSRKWPEASVKDEVINGGIHLVAMPTAKGRDELWRMSFRCARRRLIRSVHGESKEKCVRILKVLYEQDLLRPKGISPRHLENIVLWASRKYWSPSQWSDGQLPDRFLELLAALYKCLKNQDCYDFFVPASNLFAQFRPEVLQVLAAKVRDVMDDPFKYLQP